MKPQKNTTPHSKLRYAFGLFACALLAFLLVVPYLDCGTAYGYTGKALREDARGKWEAFQGKVQEYSIIKPPGGLTEDALRKDMNSSEQSQSEVQSNDASEKTEQRPNACVPDEDETPDEDEEKDKQNYDFAAVVFLALFVAAVVIFAKHREAISGFASRNE